MIQIMEVGPDDLSEYAAIPIAFKVSSRFRLEAVDRGLGGIGLSEEAVLPYMKDYDSLPGESPLDWANRWDLSTWGFLAAFEGDRRVGCAAIAPGAPELTVHQGAGDVAALWDIRVHPEYRRRRVGSHLFNAAADWARSRGSRVLLIEAQNINVPACRFYAAQGCELAAIDVLAYPPEMGETRLLWRLNL